MMYFELRDKIKIPAIAYGPDEIGYRPGVHPRKTDMLNRILQKAKKELFVKPGYIRAVACAIKEGFHFIDWASAYGDGRNISKAIAASGARREDLILTTRIGNTQQITGG